MKKLFELLLFPYRWYKRKQQIKKLREMDPYIYK